MRRQLTALAVAATALALVGCSGTEPGQPSETADQGSETAGGESPTPETGPLIIGIWGGVWETAINEVIPGFTEEYGIDVVLDVGSSNDRVAKLEASGGTAMDVVFMTPESMIAAQESEVLASVTETEVPNLATTEQVLLDNFAVDGGYFAVPVSWTSTGILWREDLVPFEITSLEDLWRPELEGRVAIQNMPTLGAASFLIATSYAFGGSQTDIEVGWQKLAELKPNIQQFYSVSSDALAALVAGDLWAVSTIANQGIALADQNVVVTLPSEGVAYSIQAAAISSGTERPVLAAAFLDYLLRPEVQAIWSEYGQAGPSGVDVELSAAAEANIAENPALVPNLVDLDFQDMSDNMQEWSERWQREIAN